MILGIAVVAVAGLLMRTVKGIVSLVENLLPSLTPKEASTAAAIFASIGLLCTPMESGWSLRKGNSLDWAWSLLLRWIWIAFPLSVPEN